MGCDFTFVHCADLHLGSRFDALTSASPELGGRLYEAVFSSFRRIVDLAAGRADFMVIAGDVYDDVCETLRTRLFFASEILTGNFFHFSQFARRFFFFGVLLYGVVRELFSFCIAAVALRAASRRRTFPADAYSTVSSGIRNFFFLQRGGLCFR